MSLPEFLLARADELEAAARAASEATDRDWLMFTHPDSRYGERAFVSGADDGDPVAECEGSPPAAVAAHIAAWDPARVLAWCAAIRAVVELHRHEAKGPGPVLYDGSRDLNEGVFGCVICSCVDDDPGWHFTGGWCDTLRQLAAIWADHPDFDPAWRV